MVLLIAIMHSGQEGKMFIPCGLRRIHTHVSCRGHHHGILAYYVVISGFPEGTGEKSYGSVVTLILLVEKHFWIDGDTYKCVLFVGEPAI